MMKPYDSKPSMGEKDLNFEEDDLESFRALNKKTRSSVMDGVKNLKNIFSRSGTKQEVDINKVAIQNNSPI